MTWSLAATAVLMGLAGGPHCIAMCGAACAGIGQAGAPRGTLAIGWFQVGRLTGYTLLGAMLLIWARQPVWLEWGARRVWARVRTVTQRFGLAAPLGVGVAWALLPCGLLYSAAMVAALAGSVTGGAAVMALFALGSGLTLWLGPWLLLRLGRSGRGAWGMRLAGLALLLTSAWGLWMGLMHDQAPWCVVPAA